MAGLNGVQLFHQTGGKGSTSCSTRAATTGAREGINWIPSGTSGDVRTLCKAGQLKEALHILNQQGILEDPNTYAYLLQECIRLKDLAVGKQLHAHIIQSGYNSDTFVLNTLVNMYAKCGSVVDARQVFENMSERNLFTWTTMIGGYAKHGYGREAFKIYEQMQHAGVTPNKVTFICVLKACASLGALEKGQEVHADIIKAGIVSDIRLENTLVDMYAKCASMEHALRVFNNMAKGDVVSWNAMIAGYAQHGCGREAFEIYEQMIQQGMTPNRVTFTCVLNACASLGTLERGKEVHVDIRKAGIAPDLILQTALVDMYAKCGSMKDACGVFDSMAQRNVVSWSAMIAGYSQQGCGREAFEMYEQMVQDGVSPNKITFICILNACASLGALDKGIEVHSNINKAGIVPDVILKTALVDMYAKCGSMKDAREIFDNMAERNVVSWSAMIAGYAQHGCAREALQLFEQSQQEGLKPDGITFICLLSACSHMGLVDEGRHYFESMSHNHGLTPTVEHFGCMVDLLGRAGRLGEAEEFINKMPIKPGSVVWMALLGACKVHGAVEVAERVVKSILKSDPQDAAAFVLLSNIYAAAGRWDNKSEVRKMMEQRGSGKELGCSCIEVHDWVQTLIVEVNGIHN